MSTQPDGDGNGRNVTSSRPTPKNRAATERRLLNAARELLAERGVLSGLNLSEVADLAGVNRALIYQYFGSRRELLSAALGEREWLDSHVFRPDTRDPFRNARRDAFAMTLRKPQYIHFQALLAVDRDEDLVAFPRLDTLRASLERDRLEGELPEVCDLEATYLATSALYRGYAIFREVFAREWDLDLSDLDERMEVVVHQIIDALATGGPSAGTCGHGEPPSTVDAPHADGHGRTAQ